MIASTHACRNSGEIEGKAPQVAFRRNWLREWQRPIRTGSFSVEINASSGGSRHVDYDPRARSSHLTLNRADGKYATFADLRFPRHSGFRSSEGRFMGCRTTREKQLGLCFSQDAKFFANSVDELES